MKVIAGFTVLLVGVGAVAWNLAEPRRFTTDMVSLKDSERLAAFATLGDGAAAKATAAPEQVAEFETTVRAAKVSTGAITPASDARPIATNSVIDEATRRALARDIEGELARLGCYAGPVDGNWSAQAQHSAEQFVTKANVRMSVGEPDIALFGLTKEATPAMSCGPAIAAVSPATIEPPSMALGGPSVERREKAPSYRRDREVEALFTNPLGR